MLHLCHITVVMHCGTVGHELECPLQHVSRSSFRIYVASATTVVEGGPQLHSGSSLAGGRERLVSKNAVGASVDSPLLRGLWVGGLGQHAFIRGVAGV